MRREASSFYHYNHLGTALALTGADEAVTDTYRHDAWGVLLASTGSTANPHTYVGRERYYRMPNAAMYHLGFRDYAQGVGRFTTVDPVGRTFAPYSYVQNSVSKRHDELGLFSPIPWPFPGMPELPSKDDLQERLKQLEDLLRGLRDWILGDPEMEKLCYEIVGDQLDAAKKAAYDEYERCKKNCRADVRCSPPPGGWPAGGRDELVAPVVAACIAIKCAPALAASIGEAEAAYALDHFLCWQLYGADPTKLLPPENTVPLPRPFI